MPPNNLRELVDIFVGLIRLAMPVVLSLALLTFIWGLVKFIARVGGEKINDLGYNCSVHHGFDLGDIAFLLC
jgi:hypothetical protein